MALRYLLPGGAAAEMEICVKLSQYADTVGGKLGYCIKKYAEAFEVNCACALCARLSLLWTGGAIYPGRERRPAPDPDRDRAAQATQRRQQDLRHQYQAGESPAADSGLLDVFISTGGAATWTTSTNWLTATHPCTWFGVTCDSGNNVILYGAVL